MRFNRLFAVLFLFAAGHASAQISRPGPRLPPGAAAIAGVVRETSGVTLPDVTVVISNANGDQWGAITGKSGEFRIEGLPTGMYRLNASRKDPSGNITAAVALSDVRLADNELTTTVVEFRPAPLDVVVPAIRRPGSIASPAAPLPDEVLSEKPLRLERPARKPPAVAVASVASVPDFVRVENRWRVSLPPYMRYPNSVPGDFPYSREGAWWDPYHQNLLKGDLPMFGNRWFMSFGAASETIIENRQVKVENGSASSGFEFRLVENLLISTELFRGLTAFRPADFRVRITPAFNASRLSGRPVNMRWDGQAAAFQEAFAEARLLKIGPNFDFASIRAGTQFFKSDFRGFVFSDNEPGVRLFGNLKSNRHQYNLAYFHMLQKDPNSFLNTRRSRKQEVVIANYYLQDFLKPGYTAQFSVHVDRERMLKRIDAAFLGWTGDGHFGRVNVNHALYEVFGNERTTDGERKRINAQMAALELSLDQDWRRYRTSFFYASGDGNPQDGTARGFDSIFDNVDFAGGPISFWNRQEIRLVASGVALTNRASLQSGLRGSKELGQTNFTNPGLYLLNGGFDADITPKLRASANLNLLSFARTAPLEALLSEPSISRGIGLDVGSGIRWRPLLSENVVVLAGASGLLPTQGFRKAFDSRSLLLSAFLELRFVY